MLFGTHIPIFVVLSVELYLVGKISFRVSGGCSYDGNQIINVFYVSRM